MTKFDIATAVWEGTGYSLMVLGALIIAIVISLCIFSHNRRPKEGHFDLED